MKQTILIIKQDNTPAGAGVASVNGRSGVVTLAKSDVGLGNVSNTSDTTKNAAVATLTNKTIDGSANTLFNLPAAGILGVIPVANLATGTPTGSKFLRDDGVLAVPPGSGGGAWGGITGTLSAQTDLQSALDLKANASAVGTLFQQGFTGTGSQFVFTLSSTPTGGIAEVSYNGQIQEPGVDYSISGTTLTFLLTAPAAPNPGTTKNVWVYSSTAAGGSSGITALTGDVTASGTGSVAATIATGVVSLSKMANMATASLLGRNTAGTGAPEVLSASTVRSLLGLVIGTNVQAWDADLDTWTTKTAPTGVVLGTTDTQTISNKRNTPRTTTIASSATPTINTDNCDFVTITAIATAITSMTSGLSGTPVNGDPLVIRIKDDGTPRAITWGTSWQDAGGGLIGTTVAGKIHTLGFLWNSVVSKWDCVSASVQP